MTAVEFDTIILLLAKLLRINVIQTVILIKLDIRQSVGGLEHDHADIAAISIACSHQLYDSKVEVV